MPIDTAAELETTVCPLCGSDRAAGTLYAAPPFRIVRCVACTLWYLNPRPREDRAAANYRRNDYFVGGDAGYSDYRSQERSLRAGFRALLRELQERGLTGGRLLEAGSGYGYFLDEARDHFADRVGIELSAGAARAAAQLSGAIVHESIDTLPSGQTFDVVFASHVIEHIYDPVSFTRRLIARLRPGGTIVFSTPNMSSFWRKLMGPRWPSFKFPEHVTFFDSKTLRQLFEHAGAVDVRPIRVLDRFPASEVLAKLNLQAPAFARGIDVPLPATSVCAMARAPGRSRAIALQISGHIPV